MKGLVKYFENREEAINSLLGKPRQKYTPETFHKLRVEIKKMKALFDLINFCDKKFKQRKTFEPFKLIFRQAGKVRELQLEEAMLKKYFTNNTLSNYRRSLRKQRLKERTDFFLVANDKVIKNLKKKYNKVFPFINEVNNKKAKRYLEQRRKSIRKLTTKDELEMQQLHKLRKLVLRQPKTSIHC